jgi:uncharacterized protein with GYD domain
MPTYIVLTRFTPRGLENLKDSPARVQRFREMLTGLGARLKDFYSVTGQYDSISVVEAPNDEAMAKAALALGSLGNVRTETLRAFTEQEYRDLIASLP